MLRPFVLSLLLATPVLSQLASTSDGSFFDFPSFAALKHEPLALNRCRIYRHGPQPILQTPEIPGVEITGAYLSSDASTTGVYGFNSSSRLLRLQRDGVVETVEGDWLAVSRNSRFVASINSAAATLTVRDRLTGQTHQSPAVPQAYGVGTISDQGAVVLFDAQRLWHIPFGQPRILIQNNTAVIFPVITAQGDHVFVLNLVGSGGRVPAPPTFELLEIQIPAGTRRTLYRGQRPLRSLSPSDDGSRLLVQATTELLLWNRATDWSSLLSYDEGFQDSLLSGNGRVAFARTAAGRLLRIDVDKGSVEQLYAPFPDAVYQDSGGAYPGSVLRFVASPGRPDLTFTIDGTALPIIKMESSLLDAQIPWERTDWIGREQIAEISAPDTPFVMRRPVHFAADVEPWAFTFALFPNYKFSEIHLIASREDFSERIDPVHPTTPGSLVHFWLTGLGPVDQPVATGQPAPKQPAARPLASLSCTIAPPGSNQPRAPLEVLDVTYAPDLIGVYQVDIRIPTDYSNTRADIRCSSNGSPATGGLIAVRP